MKLTIKPDCGNAPKKEFIKDLNIAFASNDIAFLLDSVTNDIRWTLVGDSIVEGKDQFEEALIEMNQYTTTELVLESILTHGKEGAASGFIRLDGGSAYEFADFYEFSGTRGAKVKSIKSFVIQKK